MAATGQLIHECFECAITAVHPPIKHSSIPALEVWWATWKIGGNKETVRGHKKTIA